MLSCRMYVGVYACVYAHGTYVCTFIQNNTYIHVYITEAWNNNIIYGHTYIYT